MLQSVFQVRRVQWSWALKKEVMQVAAEIKRVQEQGLEIARRIPVAIL